MDELERAAQIIKKSGIIIFPTDTAYGIGCSLENQKAVDRLFELRKRPTTQATPVLFDSIEQVEEYSKPFNSKTESLMRKYWPGALTIIVECDASKVPSLVRGGGSTIGCRIPNNKQILKIIEKAGVPILGPSANFHGESTPFSFEELDPKLTEKVEFVVKGEVSLKKPSTVIDCSVNPWRILRQGAIDLNL